MRYELNGLGVEVEVDKNRDGSKFFAAGYYEDSEVDLTSEELNELQEIYDNEINGMWG